MAYRWHCPRCKRDWGDRVNRRTKVSMCNHCILAAGDQASEKLKKQYKIAVDTQISNKAVSMLTDDGVDVVFHASSEPDHWWFEESLRLGAEAFVSPDADIRDLSKEHGAYFIRVHPEHNTPSKQRLWILSELIRFEKEGL